MTYTKIKELFCRGKLEDARKLNKHTDQEIFDKIMVALEKQIPKKPLAFILPVLPQGRLRFKCPYCGILLGDVKTKYCSECGEKIKWSEDEGEDDEK